MNHLIDFGVYALVGCTKFFCCLVSCACPGIFPIFWRLLEFSKSTFINTIRVSYSLDPNQAWRYVEPDLGLNCLQKLSTDDTRR